MTRLQKFINQIIWFWASITWKGKFIGTAIRDWFMDANIRFVIGIMERMEIDWLEKLAPMLKMAEDTKAIPPALKPILDEMKKPKSFVGSGLMGMAGSQAAGGLISSTIGPWLLLIQYQIQRLAKQFRLPLGSIVEAIRREIETKVDLPGQYLDQGLTKEQFDVLMQITKVKVDAERLITLRARKEIETDEYLARMLRLGYDETDAEDLFKALEFYPTPGDLVNWQAREVFEPEMIARYGLMSEYGEIDKEPFYKARMTDEQIANYWKAHWDHASWIQVQDMLFRGELTEAEVWDWFRLVEIPPFWRQRLINIAYHPYTRVDVRRMHKIGVLTEEELVRSYMDLGYNRERAEKMKDFTVLYNQGTTTEKDRDLTKSDILRLFREGIIPEAEAEAMLLDMDYDPEEIAYLIDLNTQELALRTRDLTLSQVKQLYQRGLRPKKEVTEFLAAFGYDKDEIIALYELWEWEKPIETKEKENSLSLSHLRGLYERTILTREQALSYLLTMGYSHTDIGYIFDLWDYQKPLPIRVKSRDLSVSHLKQLYQQGLRSKADITPLLATIGYDSTEIAVFFELWDWVKPATVKRPTRTQLDKFLGEGIIDLQTWSDELGALGYELKYQEWYFALMIESGDYPPGD